MSSKTFIHETDEEGRSIVAVPLGWRGARGTAILYEEDFNFLIQKLGLSIAWNRKPGSGYVIAGVADNKHVSVARVLMDAGEGQNVRYLDGDPTNLRRDNLELVVGWGTRRDRNLLEGRKVVHVQA